MKEKYIDEARRDINIDVDIYEEDELEDFDDDKMGMVKIIAWIAACVIIIVGLIAGYELFKPKKDYLTIVSSFEDVGSSRGWELTPALESAIESGEISLKNITVSTCGLETTLSGGDSDKLAILGYHTEIEDNEKLKAYGETSYIVRTLGLAEEKKGAE